MQPLKNYYDSKIEGQRFVEFLGELNKLFSKDEKIKIYKLWIMGYTRQQIQEQINK